MPLGHENRPADQQLHRRRPSPAIPCGPNNDFAKLLGSREPPEARDWQLKRLVPRRRRLAHLPGRDLEVLTPERLRDKSRTAKAVEALCNLGTVAGNHGRFLFDFSPYAVDFRLTQDAAARLLYCFGTDDDGKAVTANSLVQRIKSEDIKKDELIVGVTELESALAKELSEAGLKPVGVKAACSDAVMRVNAELKIKE